MVKQWSLRFGHRRKEIDKLDFIEIKSFVFQRTLPKNEKATHRSGKILANHLSGKGLVSGMYRKLLQLKIERQPSFKKVKPLNSHVASQRRHANDQ